MLILFTMMLFAACSNTPLSETGDSLHRLTYTSAATGEDRDYFVWLPHGYEADADKQWPVLMFLHGNGERGNARDELDFVLIHGPLYEAWVQRRELPFVIVSPQLPMYRMAERPGMANRDRSIIPSRLDQGSPARPTPRPPAIPMSGVTASESQPFSIEGPPDGWDLLAGDLLDILDQVEQTYRTDADRVYLTGLSYGGFGTWYMASQFPDRFAAVAPVVGYGHPDMAGPIARAGLPVWCFAGGRDTVVPAEYFYGVMNSLEAQGHREALLTVHEHEGHDAWIRIYGGHDLYHWFLSHTRRSP